MFSHFKGGKKKNPGSPCWWTVSSYINFFTLPFRRHVWLPKQLVGLKHALFILELLRVRGRHFYPRIFPELGWLFLINNPGLASDFLSCVLVTQPGAGEVAWGFPLQLSGKLRCKPVSSVLLQEGASPAQADLCAASPSPQRPSDSNHLQSHYSFEHWLITSGTSVLSAPDSIGKCPATRIYPHLLKNMSLSWRFSLAFRFASFFLSCRVPAVWVP